VGQDSNKKRPCEKRSLLLNFFLPPELSGGNTLQGKGSSPGSGQGEYPDTDSQLSGKDSSAVEESTLESVALATHIEEISFEGFLKSRLKKIDSGLNTDGE